MQKQRDQKFIILQEGEGEKKIRSEHINNDYMKLRFNKNELKLVEKEEITLVK